MRPDLSHGGITVFHPSPTVACLFSFSAKDPFLPFQCSFSSRTSRCFCVLDHNEDEIRLVHFAYLCMTSIAGNTTSSLQGFTPMAICESWRRAGRMIEVKCICPNASLFIQDPFRS